MSGFSIAGAAFTGFQVIRTRPTAVAVWGVIQLLFSTISAVLLVGMAGPALMQLQAAQGQTPRDPSETLAALGRLMPAYGLLLLVSLVFYPVLYAAMNRVVLRPTDSQFAYLRLGPDELRQFLLMFVYFVLLLGAYFALVIAAVIVGVIVGVLGTAAGAGGAVVGGLLAAILFVAAFCAFLFLAVRLSLASALTFATQKLDVFGSWVLTRGKFWPLLGAYVLAVVAAMLIAIIGAALGGAAGVALGGANSLTALFFRPDMSSLNTFLTPARIVYLLLNGVATAVAWPILLTPAPAIYRNLTGGGAALDAVFS